MTPFDFAKKLNSIDKKSEILEVLYGFINNHSGEFEKSAIKNLVENISEEKFTSFGNKLGFCKKHCIDETDKATTDNDTDYRQKLNETEKILVEFSAVYQEIIKHKEEADTSNTSEANLQNKKVVKELNTTVASYREELKDANNKIDNSVKMIDGKIFSLLINTVAILGIFVAIAFTGFGVTSIFSNIDIETSIVSTAAFLKNVYFLLMVMLASYNLLLILIYFLFKLSRPLFVNTSITQSNDKESILPTAKDNFKKAINLTPFLWIDGILFVLTLAMFICCLICK